MREPGTPSPVAAIVTTAAVLAITLDVAVARWLDRLTIPAGDDAALTTQAAARLNTLHHDGLWAALQRGDTTGAPYPPLVPLVGGLAGGWAGLSGLLSSLALWEGVGAAAAAWAGQRLLGAWGGVVGAVGWLWLSRAADPHPSFFTETAVGAFALATLVALDATDGMRRPMPAAVAGLAAGLAMLSKFTAVAYVAPAIGIVVAVAAIRALVADRGRWIGGAAAVVMVGAAGAAAMELGRWSLTAQGAWWPATGGVAAVLAVAGARSRRVLGVSAGMLALAAGVSMIWYLPNHALLIEFLRGNELDAFDSERLGFALALRYYARAFFAGLLDAPAVGLAAVGLVLAATRRQALPWLATAAAVLGAVILATTPFANHRYIRPSVLLMVPAVAAAVPVRGVRPAAGAALLWLAFLLASRAPAMRQVENRILPAEAHLGGRWRPEPIVTGTRIDDVKRYLAMPWRGPGMMLALPMNEGTASPILGLAAALDAACPPDTVIVLGKQASELGLSLGVALSWNHRRTSILMAPPGMKACPATLVRSPGGGWTVTPVPSPS